MYRLFRECQLDSLRKQVQGLSTYTYLLTVLVKTASVSSAPWRKNPVNSSDNFPASASVSIYTSRSLNEYAGLFALYLIIPKRRNNNGMDSPDKAAAPIDSNSTNLSHVVAYEKILC